MTNNFVETNTKFDEKNKIWSGPIKNFDVVSSIGKLALEALLKDPKHISQICHNNEKQYTNEDIAKLSIRFAKTFKKLGLNQCDVFGICATNSDYVAPLFLGGMLSGLIISPMDTSFTKNFIMNIILKTKPKIMFCDGSIYEIIKNALDEMNMNIPIYTMKDHLNGIQKITDFLSPEIDVENFIIEPLLYGPSQLAAILCSSGSTGMPKGISVSHESFLKTPVFVLSKNDRFLTFSTLFWLSGISVVVEAFVQGATRVINDKPFSSKDFFDIIEKHHITVMNAPPSYMSMIIASEEIEKRNLSSLKAYLCGGGSIPLTIVNKMQNYCPNLIIYSGYGVSETASIIAMGEPKNNGSNGQLTPNFQIKIINEEGCKLNSNEKGEIYIRPPVKWSGYYNDIEATKNVYDENGWIHSGDLGYFDQNGNLYVVGRIKELMKYNNFSFSPLIIEEVIYQLPGITEVCVCGISDPISSYLPAAVIVKTSESQLIEEDVINFVKEKLPIFCQLHGGVYFIKSIPKTASGKYFRNKVQEICEKLRKK